MCACVHVCRFLVNDRGITTQIFNKPNSLQQRLSYLECQCSVKDLPMPWISIDQARRCKPYVGTAAMCCARRSRILLCDLSSELEKYARHGFERERERHTRGKSDKDRPFRINSGSHVTLAALMWPWQRRSSILDRTANLIDIEDVAR